MCYVAGKTGAVVGWTAWGGGCGQGVCHPRSYMDTGAYERAPGVRGRVGQHGVGLAIKESIVREATWSQELMKELLMSMTFNLADTSNAITFFVAYSPTDTVSNTREQKNAVWEGLDSAVSRVPGSDYSFFIDTNARTGVQI